MSSLQHTPGHWFVSEGGTSNYTASVQAVSARGRLFNVAMLPKPRRGEVAANARLIAAAPDLLADAILASNEIAPWLSAALDDDNVCAEFKVAINRWLKSNHAAIEKATGELT